MAANDANEDRTGMDRIEITEQDRIDGYLIRGVTRAQKTFRPSDWPERLAGVITLFVGERRPGHPGALTRLAMPVVAGGVKCLFVSGELRSVCADAFDFAMQFAADNDLPVEVRTAPVLAVR
ncbi:PhnO [Burkholderia pseudomultivorans]|uniref:PhnO n=2 Tax=Burkholderia pseudomultivorans TaxID=1207504 RepID=A0A6P2KYV6_9BURK|nr:PhnO [Burkholderia pseudomultivorans]